jgi:serine/threonine-protein kinase RsbW
MGTELGMVFETRFENKIEELSRVSAEARQFLQQHGVGSRALYLADLSIEEMGTNILKYAYRDSGLHQIRLRLEIASGQLLMVLEDDGQPFNPVRAAAPNVNLPVQERVPGGLGVHLVRTLVDSMEYRRSDSVNQVTIKIRL